MKKIKKMLVISALLLAAVGFLLGLAGCDTNGETSSSRPSDLVDFTSHNTNPPVRVRSHTNQRLIAFMGELSPERLLGGVPARATNHGFHRNPALFDRTQGFTLILLTEQQYNDNINNLAALNNTPFARVFVFYNHTGANNAVFDISDVVGGPNTLRVINPSSSINVELRLNGSAGETMGFAPAGILQTDFRMADGNFIIFPVFVRYNEVRDLVETVIPMRQTGIPWFESFSLGEGDGVSRHITLNLRDELEGLRFASGVAWVVVRNESTALGIRFMQGAVVQETATGLDSITSGMYRTFVVNMNRIGNSFSESVQVGANWAFGQAGFEVPLRVSPTDPTPVGMLTIEQDMMYTVTVGGTPGAMWAVIDDGVPIPSNELGGSWR